MIVVPRKDKVVKSILKTLLVCAAVFALAGFLAAQTTSPQTFPVFNPPPCDFNDTFYNVNGIDVNKLDQPAAGRFGIFRKQGPPSPDGGNNWTNDSTCSINNPDTTDVRILATTAGYPDDGSKTHTDFISLIAFVLDQSFFLQNFTLAEGDNTVTIANGLNPRGFSMQSIAGNFEAYAALKQILPGGTFAPTPCGTMGNGTTPCFPVTSVATPQLRQDWRFASNRNAIDGSSGGASTPFGYFCDDILGMWILTYFWYTDAGFGPHQTTQCNQMLAALASINGISLDGTPIIKTADELNFLEGSKVGTNPIPGFSGSSPPKPGCTAEGQEDVGGADQGAVWVICPTILDPQNGAIAPDAFLDAVRKPNGSFLDPGFQKQFNCLQTTGQFCPPTT